MSGEPERGRRRPGSEAQPSDSPPPAQASRAATTPGEPPTLRRRGAAPALGAAALAVAALAASAACQPDAPTVLLVTVEVRPTVEELDALHVEVGNAGATRTQEFSLPPGARPPLTFTVTAEGRTGKLAIAIDGLRDGAHRAYGASGVEIRPGSTVPVTVVLDPDDFGVNQGVAGYQWLTYRPELHGRQAAAAPDGAFLVSWENDCPLSRCDLVGRLFGPDARPRRNSTSMSTDDFLVNQDSEYTESAAVASGSAGYLVAWIRGDLAGSMDVKATALDFDGRHVGADVVVSDHPNEERSPVAFGLADGRFVVAWERFRTDPPSETSVRARVLAVDGTPEGDAFDASQTPTGHEGLPHGAGLTADAGGGFVLAWAQTDTGSPVTNVRARVFGPDGLPATGNLPVTALTSGAALGPHVAATPSGFVVTWRASIDGASAILLRRYDAAGLPLSEPTLVAPISVDPGAQSASPAIAVLPGDGAIALAWHDCGERGDGDGCGVRERLLHPSGLPSGPDAVANTTTRFGQEAPSLVALGPGAFLLAWTDSSGAEPDTDGSGIRARALYPSLERRDGVVGARCGGPADEPCQDALRCAAAELEGLDLCHPTCVAWDEPCPEGGMCRDGVCRFE